jgi:protein-tyrosine kinase
MDALGFIGRACRRRAGLAAILFALVLGLGLTAVKVVPQLHEARAVAAAASFLCAVVVGLLGAVLADLRQDLVVEPWQLRRRLKLDVLAQFDAPLMARVRAELAGGANPGFAPVLHDGVAIVPASAVAPGPPTGMATVEQFDGFRELRTRLMTAAASMQLMPFTTLVVPLVGGSGGSFVARNLAASFAFQDGASALLVDCNLAHPTQHLALRTSADDGLFDFLDEPHVNFAPKPTAIRGLYLIPSGRARSPLRAEYLSSTKMRRLMQLMRESGRFVFLDGPAAKGSPDARILSELADFVVLVVGSGKGRTGDIAQAAAMFDPAKLAGVVFNERPDST